MALPTLSTRAPSRFRCPGAFMDWQRERRAEKQQQLEAHARYLDLQNLCNERHDIWTSLQYLNRSVAVYNRQRQREEHQASLELHRNRLWLLFQEEKNQLEEEHRRLLHERKMRRRR